ncbi:hypothetical protein FACS1894186_8220 [Alphaproteobacteria bacterium]|nr:hypothetical protein FACS1894186_8220 [Alphaproteobacteria bacterium]
MFKTVLSFAASAFLSASALAGPAVRPIYLAAPDGRAVELRVRDAMTPAETLRGLMFESSLSGYDGMLFDFGRPREVRMWMKNTYISLDMLFFDAGGVARCVRRGTLPMSLAKIACDGHKTRWVLEIEAGRADAAGLAEGSRLLQRAGESGINRGSAAAGE